jgi:toxin ParE1/3/4
MSEPIVLKRPIARIDLAVCYGYLGERNPAMAHRFRLNAEATFAALARNPGLGEPYHVSDLRLKGLRCFRIKRFRNYLVFYSPIDEGIDVIRVLHAARDIRTALKEEI